MLTIFIVLSILKVYNVVNGKVRIIPDERFQYCEEDSKKLGEGEIAYGNITDVDIAFILEDENTVFIQGALNFKMRIDRPTSHVLIEAYKFDMGQWHKRNEQEVRDCCEAAFSPLGMYYPFFKDFKRCPLEPGDKFQFDGQKLDLSFLIILPVFIGRWKLEIYHQYENESRKMLKDCFLIYADIEYY